MGGSRRVDRCCGWWQPCTQVLPLAHTCPASSQDNAVSAWTTALFLPGASATPAALTKRLRSGLPSLLPGYAGGLSPPMHLEGVSLPFLLLSDGSRVPAGVPGTTHSLLFSVATWASAAGRPAHAQLPALPGAPLQPLPAPLRRRLQPPASKMLCLCSVADVSLKCRAMAQDHNSTWATPARRAQYGAILKKAVGAPCAVRTTVQSDAGEVDR